MDYFSMVPLEILEKILKQLSLPQKLICKAVNKKWYSVVKNFKFSRLAITDDECYKRTWFLNYDPIGCPITFDLKKLSMFDFIHSNEHHFTKLKKLHLNYQSTSDKRKDFSLNDLINSLTYLDQLELHDIKKPDEAIVIKLENLNTFSIKDCDFKVIELHTPNLVNLRMISFWCDGSVIKYPKNLKVLYVDKIYSSYFEEFSNLEYLYIEHIYSGFWDLLIELPKLKELHFESSSTWNTYESAMMSKKETKNEIFKPFIFGIHFEEPDYQLDVDSFYSVNRGNIKLLKEYSNSLADHLPFIYTLNYNAFEDAFDEIPLSLMNKFVNANEIIIYGKVHKLDQLIKFLNCLSNTVTSLSFDTTHLKQDFFDQLPQLVPVLDFFKIKNEKKGFDFNFLTNFQCLKTIELDQIVAKETLDKICSKFSRTLQILNCKENSTGTVRIVRTVKNELKFFKIKLKREPGYLTSSLKSLNLNSLFGSNSSLESLDIESLF